MEVLFQDQVQLEIFSLLRRLIVDWTEILWLTALSQLSELSLFEMTKTELNWLENVMEME